MLKNRLPFGGAGTGAWPTPSSLPYTHARRLDCRWSSSLVRPRPTGSCRRTRRSSRRASRPRSPPCMPSPISRRRWMRGCSSVHPTQARQKVADDVDRVRREFVVNDKRLHRWQRWLDDDSSWPDFSVVVHGDLYVGHVLIDNTERVSGMIDWSEARVDDPAIDMAAAPYGLW
ncbi:phosphotransferase [Citrobacter freundii]|uniref:phosphotransferase n=1 Tax=Citrobacter freundii TaxID=546 RepID=UPI002F95CC57